MADKDYKNILIATKLTHEDKAIFDRICQRIGLNCYTFLNMMVSSLIKYSDERHQLDPTLQKAIDIYEGFANWGNASSIVGFGKKQVVQAIYLVANDGKQSPYAAMVDKPFFGQQQVTMNAQDILSNVIKALSPRLHRRLTAIGREMDCNTLLETIDTLIDVHSPDPDQEFIRELFSDCRRGDFGQQTDLIKYRRKKNMNHE